MKTMELDGARKIKRARWTLVVLFGCILGLVGALAGASPAVAQADGVCPRPADLPNNPLAVPAVTAAQVEAGQGELREFLEAALAYRLSHRSQLENAYGTCLLLSHPNWKSGNTYLIEIYEDGRIWFHAKNMAFGGQRLKPALLQTIAQAVRPDAEGATTIPGGGWGISCVGCGAYYISGRDIQEADLEPEMFVHDNTPAVTARDVVDRRTLKAFVEAAVATTQQAFLRGGLDAINKIRGSLRDPNGPWRHGSVYLFAVDRTGYTIFHGAFPDRFEFRTPTGTLRDAVTGELILPQLIETALSNPDGGFVEYHFDNPDDDSDSADVPKVSYVREAVLSFTLPDGGTRPVARLIFGAGIYGDPVSQQSTEAAKGWLVRFGRAVAGQAVEMISNRLTSPSSGQSQMTLAGQTMHLDASASAATSPVLESGGLAGWSNADPWAAEEDPLAEYREMSLGDALLNSSFRLALADGVGAGVGGRWTAWGRGGLTEFGGADSVSLDGSVTTAMLGVDYEQGRMLTGVAVSLDQGEGGVSLDGDHSEMKATLTSVYPHLRYAMTERFSMWGILGFGRGEMTLEENAIEKTVTTDIEMTMGALGVRGELLSAAGLDLALKSDVMLMQMTSDERDGLESIEANTTRFRAMLEGSRELALESGGSLRPSVEAGVRHDGGDAEEGAGLELGGRIAYSTPSLGLTMEAGGRTLVAHQDSGASEWGLDGSLRLAPGAQGRGLSFTMGSTWGEATSGVGRLWTQRSAADLAQGSEEKVAGFGAEVGYGLPALGVGLLTPYAGLTVSNRGTETYRAGGRLDLASSFSMSLEGTRRKGIDDDPDHGVMLRGALRW